MTHLTAYGKWLGLNMAYLVIVAYIDGTSFGGLRGKPFWIFLNTFATGFTLTFEQFYFEVVFVLWFLFSSMMFISVWSKERPYD